MNRDENSQASGDVKFDEVAEIASLITPVPGGVGPWPLPCWWSRPTRPLNRSWIMKFVFDRMGRVSWLWRLMRRLSEFLLTAPQFGHGSVCFGAFLSRLSGTVGPIEPADSDWPERRKWLIQNGRLMFWASAASVSYQAILDTCLTYNLPFSLIILLTIVARFWLNPFVCLASVWIL